jgi:hypothetical protein
LAARAANGRIGLAVLYGDAYRSDLYVARFDAP